MRTGHVAWERCLRARRKKRGATCHCLRTAPNCDALVGITTRFKKYSHYENTICGGSCGLAIDVSCLFTAVLGRAWLAGCIGSIRQIGQTVMRTCRRFEHSSQLSLFHSQPQRNHIANAWLCLNAWLTVVRIFGIDHGLPPPRRRIPKNLAQGQLWVIAHGPTGNSTAQKFRRERNETRRMSRTGARPKGTLLRARQRQRRAPSCCRSLRWAE